MAKILIEFDTKEKTLSVTKDGKKVPNISNIYINSYDGKGYIELKSSVYNEEEGTTDIHCVYASEESDKEIDIDNLAVKIGKALKCY